MICEATVRSRKFLIRMLCVKRATINFTKICFLFSFEEKKKLSLRNCANQKLKQNKTNERNVVKNRNLDIVTFVSESERFSNFSFRIRKIKFANSFAKSINKVWERKNSCHLNEGNANLEWTKRRNFIPAVPDRCFYVETLFIWFFCQCTSDTCAVRLMTRGNTNE